MALEKKLRAKFSLPDDHLAIISAAEKVITTNGIQIYGLRFVPETNSSSIHTMCQYRLFELNPKAQGFYRKRY